MPQPTIMDVGDTPIMPGEPQTPITAQPEPQNIYATEDPGAPLGPPQGGESSGPEFRYRGERRPVPPDVADSYARSIGAPSVETAIQWTQMGRDAQFHREQLELERQAMADERRQLQAQYGQQGGYGPQPPYQPQYPGFQGGLPAGYPNPSPYPQPGGYPPSAPFGANPQGYAAPGGDLPYAPAPAPAPQGQGRGDANEALLSTNQALQRQTWELQAMREEARRDRQAAYQLRAEVEAKEQEAWLTRQADGFLAQVRRDGMNIPDGYTPEHLMQDCTRFGLSQSNIPWAEAFETAVARRFWRQTHQAGAAAANAALLNNREAAFQVPPARASAGGTVQAVPQGDSLEARVLRARQAGSDIQVGAALGHR